MRATLAKVGMRRSEAYLQRIRIPRDAWPGLDDVLACLENIFTLDHQFEFWFAVFAADIRMELRQRYLHEAEVLPHVVGGALHDRQGLDSHFRAGVLK